MIAQLAREYAVRPVVFVHAGADLAQPLFCARRVVRPFDRSPHTLEEVEGVARHGFAFEHGSIYQGAHCGGPPVAPLQRHAQPLPQPVRLAGRRLDTAGAVLRGISIFDVHRSICRANPPCGPTTLRAICRATIPTPTPLSNPISARAFDKQPPWPGPTYKDGSSQHPEDDPTAANA